MDYEMKWKEERERKAFLALADGAVFRGVAFGARRDALGEVVFNTGMSGYQEIVTDPSYAGQFVTLTAAEIGNYGTSREDAESRGLFLSGLVIGDLTEASSWRSEMNLDEYLNANGIPGIRDVDTRALTMHVREHGSQKAYLHVEDGADADVSVEAAVAKAREWAGLDGQDYVAKVTYEKRYELWPDAETGLHVVCCGFGAKANILRSLSSWAKVTIVPAGTSAEDVLAMRPDGVLLSNGPGDPAALGYAIENVRRLLGRVPLMGICLGHQLLSLACGARTMRLKFGHHGCNHPVKDLKTGKVEITSQNHNFAVDPASLPPCLEVTHVNLNDGTVEGVRHRTLPAFSVQYHPEACPGPHDSGRLFDAFREMLRDCSALGEARRE